MGFVDRLQHGWNAFISNRDPTFNSGASYSYRPDRPRLTRGNERSIVTPIYNRIAMDVAALDIKHVKMDADDRYESDMVSGLNYCLTTEANIDQTGTAFIQDIVMSMLDEGCVAVVPVDTTTNPTISGAFDVNSLRTGKILQWKPQHVQVRVYNEKTGQKEDIWLPKKMVSIVENPLYAVMNEPNSTMQRLIRKLVLLDAVDEQSSSGKMDLIIQLPYTIKSTLKKAQAEERRQDIENQLTGSKYGIAYVDGTEHITQLNRSVENNLMSQIEYLTKTAYGQLGITTGVMDGTADEKEMLNYYNRTLAPIVTAICDELKRKFLTKTARTQKQNIMYFRDAFSMTTIDGMAEAADKFTRNEIMTSNEIRQKMGMKPSKSPDADELRNKNLNKSAEQTAEMPSLATEEVAPEMTPEQYEQHNKDLDSMDAELDALEQELNHSELMHYASEYYDPVKAHEYYEKNKELKGRTSTAALNDKGKEAARYVKDTLTTERKGKVDEHKQQTQSQIDAKKSSMQNTIESERNSVNSQIESKKNQTQSSIDSLRSQLKAMSSADKALNKDKISEMISELRADNSNTRESLRNGFKTSSSNLRSNYKDEASSLRTDHKDTRVKLKTEYDDKYAEELDKIRNTKEFVKTKKRS